MRAYVLYCTEKAGVTHAISAILFNILFMLLICFFILAEKIFGPGNKYVTAAKMILQNSEAMISIDMPAGLQKSWSLLIDIPRGPDSQGVLVIVGDGVDIKAIEEEIRMQCQTLGHSFMVFAREIMRAITFSNLYAPEHLIVSAKDTEKWESIIENAGTILKFFLSSILARMYGGVSLDSFLKYVTVQSLATMAEIEGLEAHKRAITLRLQDIAARQVSSI
ncbi:Histidinol dehydrogenase [Citrus sinensis]|uniref:Histidinol dehydrogenase n=1 Tax=Citrus sinensis TaxID=2711 RepID=A0ACB8NQK4_CITSI|nr:Histidinol dehydrogenase [Citrus sinensis]KAH9800310.1 Histidinol dehydrogenase [Citrus sinensis]